MYGDKHDYESKTSSYKPTNAETTSSERSTEEETCWRQHVMPDRKHG